MQQDEYANAIEDLVRGSELFALNEYEKAHIFNRRGLDTLLKVLQADFQGPPLHKTLMAFHSVALSAFVTGRTSEGRMAVTTGLVYVDVGLAQWPDAPPLLEERAALNTLANKTGGGSAVYLSDEWRWPFDD